MMTRKIGMIGLFTAMLVMGIAGCGKETVNTTAPLVGALSPANGAIGVPVAQVLTATFSEPMNGASINAATFTLTGPGNAGVAGAVGYSASGSIATFTPNAHLAYDTIYTATITTSVTNNIGVEPAVLSITPSNGATGVPVTLAVTATFSTAMDCTTLSSPATNFNLTGPGTTPVAGTVTCNLATATFTPTLSLVANTLYTATITTGAKDIAEDPLATNFVSNFRTASASTVPAVISTTPANGATSVPIGQATTATFSEAMNPATINSTNFTLKAPGGGAVLGAVTYLAAGSVATFTPAVSLTPSTLYTATITTGAMDLSGHPLAANYVWTFTTAVSADATRPTVIATIPVSNATNVPLNQLVTATFSKPMNATTINSATFLLTGPGLTPVTGQAVYASIGNTAIFTPSANLLPSTIYSATLTTGAADQSGNTLAVNYVWSFTTGTTLATTKPLIVSTVPINGATGVALNQPISATFSEAMNPLTLSTGTFTLVGPTPGFVAGTVSYDPINFIATFTPSAPLGANSIYTANVTNGATDLTGNSLGNTGAPNPWSFTTGTTLVNQPVNLGTAALFGDFGGTAGLTNSGSLTVINGNIGTTGVSTKIVDLHDTEGCSYSETPVLTGGLVNGTIYTAPPAPTLQCIPNEGTAITAAVAAQASADALIAYNALAALPGGLDVSVCPGCGGVAGGAGELGTRTLAPGVYKSVPTGYNITLGDLTLDAQGNPNATWVFQMASYLTVGSPTAHRSVLLVNGAQAKNVFWQVGSFATINGILGGGTMSGTVIAQQGASVSTVGVLAITTINGRVLSLGPSVTIVNTVINVPAP